MQGNSMRICKIIMASFFILLFVGCGNSVKRTKFYPSDWTKEFVTIYSDDTIFIYKVDREKIQSKLMIKLYKFQGNYYTDDMGEDRKMVMSNSMEFDTLYSDDMNYLPHRIIVENAGNNLMSSSIFNEDVNTYLELKLVYDINYDIKYIQDWSPYITYTPVPE